MAKVLMSTELIDLAPSSITKDLEVQYTSEALSLSLTEVSKDAELLTFLSRIDELPEMILDRLAWGWHVDIYEPTTLPIERKREIVKTALLVHRYKGTPWAVKTALKALGMPVTIREDTGIPYIFDLQVDVVEPGKDVQEIVAFAVLAINETKNARSHMRRIRTNSTTTAIIYPGAAVTEGMTIFVHPYVTPKTTVIGEMIARCGGMYSALVTIQPDKNQTMGGT